MTADDILSEKPLITILINHYGFMAILMNHGLTHNDQPLNHDSLPPLTHGSPLPRGMTPISLEEGRQGTPLEVRRPIQVAVPDAWTVDLWAEFGGW